MAREIQFERRSLFEKCSIPLIDKKHVFTESHGDINIIEPIAIYVGHRRAFLLIRGNRRKVRVWQLFCAFKVMLYGCFVMERSSQHGGFLWYTHGRIQCLGKKPPGAGAPIHLSGFPAGDLPLPCSAAVGFWAFPGKIHSSFK